ncbi:MAG TPA: hypothetical protein IAA15_05500 [Candidatus Olsenella pullicola]|nr:hypothetical protein [Candidatus Olsenella pullicola]
MGERRNPAIVAGLLGAAGAVVPQTAQALSLRETLDGFFASPTNAFAAGVVGGALLTGALVGTASLISRRRRVARELPDEPDGPVDEGGEKYRPRHMRDEASAEPEAEVEVGAEVASAKEKSHSPSHAANNYEQIAENYARKMTFRARMARRAEGVASTLRERMGASMMDGVPVIERADGSVGDVGTSWWQTAVGAAAITTGPGFAADADAYAIPSDFSRSGSEIMADRAKRSEGIARRVAQVDEGAYPERRSVKDLEEADEWIRALRSMDEKIAEEATQRDPIGFIDTVGGADTLDEPDNLEPETSFIPFRTPAGHPEVVDTESYIDYLIEDEFSKNASTAVRRTSKRFLRLLEGGTSAGSRHLAGTGATGSTYVPKHFSEPLAAQA